MRRESHSSRGYANRLWSATFLAIALILAHGEGARPQDSLRVSTSIVPVKLSTPDLRVELTLAAEQSEKPEYSGPMNTPTDPPLNGGQLATALEIGSLPFVEYGTTAGHTDDFDESIPFSAPGSPDVVYTFTPSSDIRVDIDLCASSFDTRVYVYENSYTSGSPMAANDDLCGLASKLFGIHLTAGSIYYIVVDGYGGAFGDYELEITEATEVSIICPPGGIEDTDTCNLFPDPNGGCNYFVGSYLFGNINCGDTLCGDIFAWGGWRDLDWYKATFATDTAVTFQAVANFPLIVFIVEILSPFCDYNILSANIADPGDTVSVAGLLPAGEYAFVVAPRTFYSYHCNFGPWEYVCWLECIEKNPPLNDDCANAMSIDEIVATDLVFSTGQATPSGEDRAGYITGSDIFYCYTASCNGIATVDLCGSAYPTALNIYKGCECGDSKYYWARDNVYCGFGSRVDFPVVAGESYLIQIGGVSSFSGDGVLNIRCATPPLNDNCGDIAPVVLLDGVTRVISGTTAGSSSGSCGNLDGPQVWEAFTIQDTCMDVTLSFCGTSPAFGNGWLIFTYGCSCKQGAVGEYDFSSCGDGNITIKWQNVGPGTYYYPVMYDPWNNADGPYTINITGNITECMYCEARGSSCSNWYVQRVEVGDIDNLSGCDHYVDNTGLFTRIFRGLSEPITITSLWGSRNSCRLWIDWNNNFDFLDPGEEVALTYHSWPTEYSGKVAPPPDAFVGPVRMRVRMERYRPLSPCGTSNYGEIEDYTIVVDSFVVGDCDRDGDLDSADVVCLENHYLNCNPPPEPIEAVDVNCDDAVNVLDVIYFVNYLAGGPPPCTR